MLSAVPPSEIVLIQSKATGVEDGGCNNASFFLLSDF